MDITKIIIDLHILFDQKTFKAFLLASIKELEGSEDFTDLSTVLGRNVYQLVNIGNKNRKVKELVENFRRHVFQHLSHNYWTKLYLGIVEKILSFNEPKFKEGLISDIYLLLSNLELDAKSIYDHERYILESYYAENGEDIEDKHYTQIYLNQGCTNPFQIVYYSVIYQYLVDIISQLRIRFNRYIDKEIIKSVLEQSMTRRWALGIDTDEDVKKQVQEETRIEWVGNGAELAELAAALIATDTLICKNSGNANTDGKIGAYLFMLFDIKDKVTPDQYYRMINDIKNRNDKVVFLEHLKSAFETYLEEGRKTVVKRRRKNVNPSNKSK